MATKQTLLPFKILTFLLFFTIGDLIAQKDIPVVIQNDASKYPTLLFNYFKKHKATFDSCGLHFATKLKQNDSIYDGIGFYCSFLLEKDGSICIIKNCYTNLSVSRPQFDYNIPTEKSDSFLLAKWKDDLLNLLFQIDKSLITQVTNFKPLSSLLKNKDSLLTHDNLLRNSPLCDLLDSTDKVALQYFAEQRAVNWRELFAPTYEILIVPFDSRCSFKPLKYLTNIKNIRLKSWKKEQLTDDEIVYLKASGVSVTIIGENRQDKENIQQKLRDKDIKNIMVSNL